MSGLEINNLAQECILDIPAEPITIGDDLKTLRKLSKLTRKERWDLCDFGYLNDTIRGYLILAMRLADIPHDQIAQAVRCLREAFEIADAEDASNVTL